MASPQCPMDAMPVGRNGFAAMSFGHNRTVRSNFDKFLCWFLIAKICGFSIARYFLSLYVIYFR
jgi:hypothetical protein